MSGRAEVRRWVGRPDSTAPRPPPQLHTHQESLKTCQSSWWPPARPAWGCLSLSPSSGAGAPGSGLAAAVAFLSKEASFHRLLTLPVCNTHYQNDRVFSLITHYFHAARSFLTNGKNNSKAPTSVGLSRKQECSRKTSTSTIDYTKVYCVDHNKLENSSRNRNTRPHYLPSEKFVCRSSSKS